MQPTDDQIAVAAYHRWQRRGYSHGQHDDDWIAARKDLTFGLNYRWAARYPLKPGPATQGGVLWLGRDAAEAEGKPRTCRFCERAEPSATFRNRAWAVPPSLGNSALLIWDECDDCRTQFDATLAPAFDAFTRPLLSDDPVLPDVSTGVPVAALKALVRMGLSILPAQEQHYFDDANEWVTNPDHERDASILAGLGCHVYVTPSPIPASFASLARRANDESSVPYMLFFLGTSRLVLQTHLPFCPRDEDLDDAAIGSLSPQLSMSLGQGAELRSSSVVFVPAVGAEAGPANAVSPAGTASA
ncbi:MAG: DUF2934 domain-containing protein [Isosphaeraceae bacterium]